MTKELWSRTRVARAEAYELGPLAGKSGQMTAWGYVCQWAAPKATTGSVRFCA